MLIKLKQIQSDFRASISRNRIEATRSSDIDVEEDQRIFQRVDG